MIVDSSAWVEYLRGTGSPTHLALGEVVESGASLGTPSPVVMELLAGCVTEEAAARLRRLLGSFEIIEIEGLADFEDAALIQRICSRKGERVRSLMDCLIAVIALPTGRPLLARDRDFELIARHVGLELATP